MADLTKAWVVWERRVITPLVWCAISSHDDDLDAFRWGLSRALKYREREYVVLSQGEHPMKVPEQR